MTLNSSVNIYSAENNPILREKSKELTLLTARFTEIFAKLTGGFSQQSNTENKEDIEKARETLLKMIDLCKNCFHLSMKEGYNDNTVINEKGNALIQSEFADRLENFKELLSNLYALESRIDIPNTLH